MCVLIMHSAGLDKSKTEWHNPHFKADMKHSNYSQSVAAATCNDAQLAVPGLVDLSV